MYAKGYNGQVTLDDRWLTIERKGFGRIGHSKGDKRIKVDAITGIKMRPAGRLTNGFIAFETIGHEFDGGLSEAGRNDNAVIFTRKHGDQFEALREALQA